MHRGSINLRRSTRANNSDPDISTITGKSMKEHEQALDRIVSSHY